MIIGTNSLDLHWAVDAIQKAALRHEEERINERIEEIMSLEDIGDLDPFLDILFSEEIRRLFELRQHARQRVRAKTRQITTQLYQLWLRRNSGSSRSNTSAVTDMTLLTMPVPPTVKAAFCSLWQRRMANGAVA